jgi:lysozyme
MKTSSDGVEFICQFEGFFGSLYNCPANHATIGFGHLVHMGPIDGRASESEFKDGLTRDQALDLLREDLTRYEASVNRVFAGRDLEQNEYDALVSFCYNCGPAALDTASFVKSIKDGYQREDISERWQRWNKGDGKVLPGLVRRRKAEVTLYFDGVYGDGQ